MTDIKFRYIVQHEDTGVIITKVFTLDEIETRYALNWFESLGDRWFIVAKNQFTGLHDKNGKEIYEGDILKYYLPTLERWHTGKVEWSDDWAGFWITDKKWSDPDWVKLQQKEVIGNVWENPELI